MVVTFSTVLVGLDLNLDGVKFEEGGGEGSGGVGVASEPGSDVAQGLFADTECSEVSSF